MQKFILNTIILGLLLVGCTIADPNRENLEFSHGLERTGESAFEAFQNNGVMRTHYLTLFNEDYWMWLDLRPNSGGINKNKTMAHIPSGGPQRFQFERECVDIIFHKNPEYNNQFIIDLGKEYNRYFSRYIFVEKTGKNSFRGAIISYIKWDVDTYFEFARVSEFPTEHVVVSDYYNDVTTTGLEYVLENPLQHGVVASYDALRKNEVISFNYLTKDNIQYHMWIDLRTGADNTMQIVYHKPGILKTQFLSKRKVFNLFYNPSNGKEMIIDLGKQNDSINRYIYLIQIGQNRFRGTMMNTIQWGVQTIFEVSKTPFPNNTTPSEDYLKIDTKGAINGIKVDSIGQNPQNYQEALAEATTRIKNISGARSINVTFTSNISQKLVGTYQKQFSYTSKNGVFNQATFISISKLDGSDNKGQLFKNYYGERIAAELFELYEKDLADINILYRNQDIHGEVLKNLGYKLYVTESHFATHVKNIKIGGNNIWNTILLDTGDFFDPLQNRFLVKPLRNGQFVILDIFQSDYSAFGSGFGPIYNIKEKDFDFHNPSAKYIYK